MGSALGLLSESSTAFFAPIVPVLPLTPNVNPYPDGKLAVVASEGLSRNDQEAATALSSRRST